MTGQTPINDAVRRLYGGSTVAVANFRSVEVALAKYGARFGLDRPHRLAHFLAQLAHESGGFRYDREVWGPTPAQARYDTRTDLGNTAAADGDGKKYMGRTGIQLTGKANVERFQTWCAQEGLAPPNFVANPELLNTDPWEGLAPIWFWFKGSGKSLNALADANDIEQITKRINGGMNGFVDRLERYTRVALALAGFNSVAQFQTVALKSGLYTGELDGDSGPKTRAALHKFLASQAGVTVPAAPVTETVKVDVPVTPAGAENTGTTRWSAFLAVLSSIGAMFTGLDDIGRYVLFGFAIVAILVMLWRGEQIAARARAVIAAFRNV